MATMANGRVTPALLWAGPFPKRLKICKSGRKEYTYMALLYIFVHAGNLSNMLEDSILAVQLFEHLNSLFF